MADAFISYQRKPSGSLAQLIQVQLKNQHGISAYLDTTRTDSTKVQFPERLMTAISDSPTFICLLSDSTLSSDWVNKEIQHAYDLQKHCIPVFQESYVKPDFSTPAIDYLLNFDGVHVFDIKNVLVEESINKIAKLVSTKKKFNPLFLTAIPLLILIIGFVIIIALGNREENTPLTDVIENNNLAQLPTTESNTTTATQTEVQTATATQWTPTSTLTNTDTSTPSITPSSTPTFTATSTHTLTPTQLPTHTPTPVANNDDWSIVERDFNGVIMVLVPVGCFMMGTELISDNEKPVPPICFSQPFWIDKYEVTNEQFRRISGVAERESEWNGDEYPRDSITWFEARAFCEQRNARLPNEAEWEYSSRGPSNLTYPWGNDFIANNLVYSGNSNSAPRPVGSRSFGVSWVGAMDMSGNVWEWTASMEHPEPYVDDGSREDLVEEETVSRIIRGGSWVNNEGSEISASYRGAWNVLLSNSGIGFRCARNYDG